MRIIIANKYYFKAGGPEHYLFTLSGLLEQQGHTVIPFSISASKNESTPYADYFVSSPVGDELYDAKLTAKPIPLSGKIQMARRAFYSKEAYEKLRRLIRDTQADIVYVLNFSSYLSPSIIDAAHDEKIPIVVQLPSFDLVCAANNFFRDGHVCTECQNGKFHAIQHRCVGGSLVASVAKVSAMTYHDIIGIYRKVDAFATPSKFMRERMIDYGIPSEKLHHIPLFVDVKRFSSRPANEDDKGYILYFGRISPEKGTQSLIEAYALLGPSAPSLILMGWIDETEGKILHRRISELGLKDVHFIGPKFGEEMVNIIKYARFAVVPSICFDNTPHATYEAFGCGRPVIATDLGSLPEQVQHETNGLLFEYENPQNFAEQMRRLLDDPKFADRLGMQGYQIVHSEFTAEKHIERTMRLFNQLVHSKSTDNGQNLLETVKRKAI